ncbi:MAG: helix-turn-helix transcriptional regulator [Rhodocyclales bacterium]|nr:helix-turn-helix transcriptional regulator [Rhodocyclales bacterium]
MATKKINFCKLADLRIRLGLTQAEFWNRYGVKQSAASRYERDDDPVHVPHGVAMLIWLHQIGELTEEQLDRAVAATKSVVRTRPDLTGAMLKPRSTRSDKGKPAKRRGIRRD